MLESTSPAFGGSGHNETGPPPALEYQGLRFLVSINKSSPASSSLMGEYGVLAKISLIMVMAGVLTGE